MFKEKDLKRLCEESSEVQLYFTINTLGGFIWRMNHDMADGRIPKEDREAIDRDIEAAQEEIKFAVSKTTRFGVTKPTNEDCTATEDYRKWFRGWDSYIKSLPEEEWRQLDHALSNSQDVSAWRPKVD